MRIRNLELKNFAGHRRLSLTFAKPAVFLFGPNGIGKTSIREAVKWLLTGRSRVTDRAGRGAAKLLTLGVESDMSVAATLQGDVAIDASRSISGSTSKFTVWPSEAEQLTGVQAEAMMDKLCSGERALLEAVTDPTWLLTEVTPTDRSKILSSLINTTSSLDLVESLMAAEGCEVSAIERFRAQATITGASRPGPHVFSLQGLADLHGYFYDKRKTHKAAREEAAAAISTMPPIAVPSEAEAVDARAFLQETREQLTATNERKGELRARANEKTRLEARAVEMRKTVGADVATQSGLDLEVEQGPSIADQLGAIDTALNVRDAGRRKISGEVIKSNRLIAEIQGQIASIESGDVTCPSVCAPAPCPILEKSAKERKKDLPGLKSSLSAEMESLANATAASKEVEEAIAELLKQQKVLTSIVIKQSVSDEHARKDLEEVEQQLAGADLSILDETIAENAAVAKELEDKFYKTEQLLRSRELAAKSIGKTQALEEQLQKAAADAATADQIVTALDPRRVPAKILGAAVGPLQEWLEKFADVLWPGARVRIFVHPKDGMSIEALPPATEAGTSVSWLSPSQLSASEQMRLGIVLSAVIAQFTGARFLMIDAADLFDGDGRGNLTNLIQKLLEHDVVDQVIVLSTADADSVPAAIPGVPESQVVALTTVIAAPVLEHAGA